MQEQAIRLHSEQVTAPLPASYAFSSLPTTCHLAPASALEIRAQDLVHHKPFTYLSGTADLDCPRVPGAALGQVTALACSDKGTASMDTVT